MPRYRHKAGGSVIEVREGKAMDPTQWESIKSPTPQKPPARKSPAKKPDEK